jgi:membrane protein implicated in regulation of membrane protease activity
MRVLCGLLAILLFFPGACFAFFGVALIGEGGWWLLFVAVAIFTIMYFLGRYGFHDDTDRMPRQ